MYNIKEVRQLIIKDKMKAIKLLMEINDNLNVDLTISILKEYMFTNVLDEVFFNDIFNKFNTFNYIYNEIIGY